MPGRNQTGPTGMGPKTGRGDGDCSGAETPGSANVTGGRGRGMGGRGRGMGRGLGRRNRFHATGLPAAQQTTIDEQTAGSIPPVQDSPGPALEAAGASEVDALRQQAEIMDQQMQRLHERIEQLEVNH